MSTTVPTQRSITENLYYWEKSRPHETFLRQPEKGQWTDYSWARCADEIRRMAAAIQALGLPAGSRIAIISKNCAHWLLADYAIWMSGHASVPLYASASAESIAHILNHCEAKLVFLGKLDDFAAVKESVPANIPTISFPYPSAPPAQRTWDDVIKAHAPLKTEVVRDAKDLATIIYTSGTTGLPKGVMHNFAAFDAIVDKASEIFHFDSNDRFFSYLPLAHIADRVLSGAIPLRFGAHISFCESIESFGDNLRETRPTIFLGVPRIWHKLQEGVGKKIPLNRLKVLLRIPLIGSLLKNKIRNGLGFDRLRFAVTGAAPTPESYYTWFASLGVMIVEGYGMSENLGLSHICRLGPRKPYSVGPPYPGVDVKLSETGEVLVRSPANTIGYYREPALTAEAFEGEYFKTGDRGTIAADDSLTITGRSKDIFKTAKGKYVAPAVIESKLAISQDFEQICVVGNGLVQPLALVLLSAVAKARTQEETETALKALIKDINSQLEPHERVSRLVVLNDAWDVGNGLLTPSFKIKRHEIENRYSNKFETWARSSTGPVVWVN